VRTTWRRVSSEADLVALARGGAQDAAEELVRRHWPDAWRAALLMTRDPALAEDVVQDAFERALRGLGGFDGTRPFAPWLHRIVTNRALDLLPRGPRVTELDETVPSPTNPYVLADDTTELIDALGELSAERRSVVILRLLFGYSPSEVAELLEIEVGTVHSRLSRGLAELRGRLVVSDGA
jgi:RNA polymerase sigma-70 factor (ECF subfamily)